MAAGSPLGQEPLMRVLVDDGQIFRCRVFDIVSNIWIRGGQAIWDAKNRACRGRNDLNVAVLGKESVQVGTPSSQITTKTSHNQR